MAGHGLSTRYEPCGNEEFAVAFAKQLESEADGTSRFGAMAVALKKLSDRGAAPNRSFEACRAGRKRTWQPKSDRISKGFRPFWCVSPWSRGYLMLTPPFIALLRLGPQPFFEWPVKVPHLHHFGGPPGRRPGDGGVLQRLPDLAALRDLSPALPAHRPGPARAPELLPEGKHLPGASRGLREASETVHGGRFRRDLGLK